MVQSRNYLSISGWRLAPLLLLVALGRATASARGNLYRIPHRKVQEGGDRVPTNLTFSGDVDKVRDMANEKGLQDRADAAAVAGAGGSAEPVISVPQDAESETTGGRDGDELNPISIEVLQPGPASSPVLPPQASSIFEIPDIVVVVDPVPTQSAPAATTPTVPPSTLPAPFSINSFWQFPSTPGPQGANPTNPTPQDTINESQPASTLSVSVPAPTTNEPQQFQFQSPTLQPSIEVRSVSPSGASLPTSPSDPSAVTAPTRPNSVFAFPTVDEESDSSPQMPGSLVGSLSPTTNAPVAALTSGSAIPQSTTSLTTDVPTIDAATASPTVEATTQPSQSQDTVPSVTPTRITDVPVVSQVSDNQTNTITLNITNSSSAASESNVFATEGPLPSNGMQPTPMPSSATQGTPMPTNSSQATTPSATAGQAAESGSISTGAMLTMNVSSSSTSPFPTGPPSSAPVQTTRPPTPTTTATAPVLLPMTQAMPTQLNVSTPTTSIPLPTLPQTSVPSSQTGTASPTGLMSSSGSQATTLSPTARATATTSTAVATDAPTLSLVESIPLLIANASKSSPQTTTSPTSALTLNGSSTPAAAESFMSESPSLTPLVDLIPSSVQFPNVTSEESSSVGRDITDAPSPVVLIEVSDGINTPSPTTTLGSTEAPTLSDTGNFTITATTESTVVSCGDAPLARAETIDFAYALETNPIGLAGVEVVRKATEMALARDIANLLLPCDVEVVQSDNSLGFEAVDFVPEDSISEEGICDAVVNVLHECTVFDGILTIYISPEADFELARYYTLTAIRETISLLDSQIEDLIRATYLGPEIANPTAFGDTEEVPGDIESGPSNLNASLVLFAVGGCAFAASVGLVYYLRRHGNSSSSFGAATQAAGSDQYTGQYTAQYTANDDPNRPLSPFSEMLPSAYRFDQDGNMSAILELDDESATQRSGIVSESGFTTDDEGSIAISMDHTAASYTAASLTRINSPNSMLGARKRHDTSMDSLLELM